jgi:regulator of replication initiation timing
MASNQILIDQLEARASELDEELDALDKELNALATKGKTLAIKADQLREKQQHYKHAANNLRAIDEIENPLPSETAGDPWGFES